MIPPFQQFMRAKRGGVAVICALCLPVLVLAAGGATDFSRAYGIRAQLQDVADSAALAGARQFDPSAGGKPDVVAASYLKGNWGPVPFTSTNVTVDGAQQTVSLSATAESPANFLPLIGMNSIKIAVAAKAKATLTQAPVCMQALNPSAGSTIYQSGNGSISASPCVFWVNSNSSSAVNLGGGGTITAAKACIVGGVQGKAGAVTPTPQNCGARADPFASMSPTLPSTCDYNSYSVPSNATTLSPGVYCGGINFAGSNTITLQPGTYVIRNGALSVTGGGSMNGTGVTFVLDGLSYVSLAGGWNYHLVAPTSGQFAGFVFYQRPNLFDSLLSSDLTGGGTLYYEGVMYFPNEGVALSGGASTSTPSPLSAFIADHFTLKGKSSINFTYDPATLSVPVPSGVLVGGVSVALVQ